jgi:hypothetical protein
MSIEELENLFHGSDRKIEVFEIDLTLNSLPCDFGNGFYTTNNYWEAVEWAENKTPISIVINEYRWDIAKIGDLKIKIFNKPDIEWFLYVNDCRNAGVRPIEFDVIIGPVAGNFDYILFNQFNNNEITKTDLIDQLKYSPTRFNQIVYTTNKAVETLTLINTIERKGGDSDE